MEEIKVFVKIDKGKIVCICKANNKGCNHFCTKDIVFYDKYRDLKECFANKGDKNYRGAK